MHNRIVRNLPVRTTLALFAVCTLALLGVEAAAAGSTGADVTVYELPGTTNWGASGGIRGYSVGTTSCNIGDTPLNWCDVNGGCGSGTTSSDHPVIGQNIYRLKNGRFDQIGASWLKHGFISLNQSAGGCGDGSCAAPPLGGNQLGVGCTDPYSSSLNGGRPMGRKSEVNPTTGVFPFPEGGGGSTATIWNQRAAVAEADLDAALNPGARYFIEGQYIAPDDAQSGNGLNNASYREVSVEAVSFNLQNVGSTVRQKSAIEVWPVIDATVELLNVDVPSVPVERFHVARKVTNPSAGVWHYEYAVHNMNSARAADRLAIRFFGATTFENIGFHDVNAHSNEPYDTADWGNTVTVDEVSWDSPAFSPAENANAIRWANMYNFWFDADRPPAEIETHVLGLFEAGTPGEVEFLTNTNLIFVDGFGTGDSTAWSQTFP
ncbi:MAG: hypothetical protein KBF21_08730 [Thermoanaerobaculia bacterium]|nr:hypothetical protein [Thermoanaerobaculia bacterium]MBP9824291.1 hypothetical protein [Thermoanaerobaculia bacterium]